MSTHRKTLARELASRTELPYQSALNVVVDAQQRGLLADTLDEAGRAASLDTLVRLAQEEHTEQIDNGTQYTPASRMRVELDDTESLERFVDAVSGDHLTVLDSTGGRVGSRVVELLGGSFNHYTFLDDGTGAEPANPFGGAESDDIVNVLLHAVAMSDTFWKQLTEMVVRAVVLREQQSLHGFEHTEHRAVRMSNLVDTFDLLSRREANYGIVGMPTEVLNRLFTDPSDDQRRAAALCAAALVNQTSRWVTEIDRDDGWLTDPRAVVHTTGPNTIATHAALASLQSFLPGMGLDVPVHTVVMCNLSRQDELNLNVATGWRQRGISTYRFVAIRP